MEINIDFDTTNLSFIKMALILHEMGVKNPYFFLRLDNKKLRGVDPYSKKLTEEQKFMIFKECSENRWYFYREVFRVVEAGSSLEPGGGVPFGLNRGNLAFLWANELNISTMMILPRQTGKTWAATADAVWNHQFIRGSNILHFNKSQSDANTNVRRISEAIQLLPMYMQHSNADNLDPSDKRKVKNNEKTLRNRINASVIAMASAGNEAKADAMARGQTAAKIWYDEIAFIFFNESIFSAATPAYEKAREVAIKNNIPYGISITTTPGDLATPHGAWSYKQMEASIKFNEKMYDYDRKELFDIINKTPDKNGFLFIQFSYLQLGETEEWYLQRARHMNNPIRARREYLLEWINTNGNSPFDPDDIELIGDLSKQMEDKATTVKVNKYFDLVIYSEYMGRKPVVIGVDVSGGVGGDASGIVVVNPETLKPMAFFRSNMIHSDKLKKLIVTIVTKRYPNSIVTVENNSIGRLILDDLANTQIKRNLYKERKVRNIDVGAKEFTKKKRRESVEYGHNTNQVSRAQMMEMLESIVHNAPAHVGFPELYNEIRHLELKNGRIDHNSATHDDLVMAYMGALWVIRYGSGMKGKGVYYTLEDKLETDVEFYGSADSFAAAEKAIFRSVDEEEDDARQLISRLRKIHPVDTAVTLAKKERELMLRTMDQRDGILLDDEEVGDPFSIITDSTQQLLLRNYNSLLSIGSEDTSIDELLNGANNLMYEHDDTYDWSEQYKY